MLHDIFESRPDPSMGFAEQDSHGVQTLVKIIILYAFIFLYIYSLMIYVGLMLPDFSNSKCLSRSSLAQIYYSKPLIWFHESVSLLVMTLNLVSIKRKYISHERRVLVLLRVRSAI